jgi:hypothetical protein
MQQAKKLEGYSGDAGWFCGMSLDAQIVKRFGVLDPGLTLMYLIRRFGFPLHGCDEYKEIAQWKLTTAHEGIILIVSPKPNRVHFGYSAYKSLRGSLYSSDDTEKLKAQELFLQHLLDAATDLINKPISVRDTWFNPIATGDHLLDGHIPKNDDDDFINVAERHVLSGHGLLFWNEKGFDIDL